MGVKDERPTSTAAAFVRELLGECERAFRDQFGDRWRPEENDLFQQFQQALLRVAGSLDGTEAPIAAERKERLILSNYERGAR